MEVRGARPDEMPEVLEMVPRVMGATREYFAAAYRNDPSARPEHSRIVRVDGQIVSHIRLYDRWQRVGPVAVHVGCVGDVCTLPEHRGRGYCRALLEDALRYWDEHGYDFSMIVSGVGVYAACGWEPLPERGFTLPAENRHGGISDFGFRISDLGPEGTATAAGSGVPKSEIRNPKSEIPPCEVRRFVRSEDLTAVAAVYAAANAERSLTTVRSPAYWERHFSWIAGEIEEAFLVAERAGQIVAYLRCERGADRLSIAEFCTLPGHEAAAQPLLDAALTFAARRRLGGIQGYLPADHPALAVARERPGFGTTETSVLLFRLVNLGRLLQRLAPLLSGRSGVQAFRRSGVQAGTNDQRPTTNDEDPWPERLNARTPERLTLSVDGQAAGLRVQPGLVTVEEPGKEQVELAPRVFFGLLFGVVEPAEALAGVPEEEAELLATLFPRGAPVYWRTDVV